MSICVKRRWHPLSNLKNYAWLGWWPPCFWGGRLNADWVARDGASPHSSPLKWVINFSNKSATPWPSADSTFRLFSSKPRRFLCKMMKVFFLITGRVSFHLLRFTFFFFSPTFTSNSLPRRIGMVAIRVAAKARTIISFWKSSGTATNKAFFCVFFLIHVLAQREHSEEARSGKCLRGALSLVLSLYKRTPAILSQFALQAIDDRITKRKKKQNWVGSHTCMLPSLSNRLAISWKFIFTSSQLPLPKVRNETLKF